MCDMIFFYAVGKKTAWKVWDMFPEVTKVFEAMFLSTQENISEEFIYIIESL